MKKIIIGASGASGSPVLIKCLEIIKAQKDVSASLILSKGAEMTLLQETGKTPEDLYELADEVFDIHSIGAGPASGSYAADGMLIVPCSMKTLAGVHSGYADNLLLRAADVTMKEQRPLVLAVRETPLNAIHLRNMHELSMMNGVHITPLMMSFYEQPKSIDDMVLHMAATLLKPFGVKTDGYRRWEGMEGKD